MTMLRLNSHLHRRFKNYRIQLAFSISSKALHALQHLCFESAQCDSDFFSICELTITLDTEKFQFVYFSSNERVIDFFNGFQNREVFVRMFGATPLSDEGKVIIDFLSGLILEKRVFNFASHNALLRYTYHYLF